MESVESLVKIMESVVFMTLDNKYGTISTISDITRIEGTYIHSLDLFLYRN